MLQLLETALVLISITVLVTHALEAYRERENQRLAMILRISESGGRLQQRELRTVT